MPKTYPTPEEIESSDERLKELETAKETLEKADVPASPELLAKIKDVSTQTREKLPKWVTEPKWIGELEELKSRLKGAIEKL